MLDFDFLIPYLLLVLLNREDLIMHNSALYSSISRSLEDLNIPKDAKEYILSRLEANLRDPSLVGIYTFDPDHLSRAFSWSDSPEGHAFWALVDMLT